CRSRHRAYLSGERERSLLEVRERRHRLEENDLRVGLTADLGADGRLGERRLPDGLALLEDDSRAAGTSNPDGPLYNCREDRIPDRVVEEAREPRIGLLEDRDGLLRLLYILAYIYGVLCDGPVEEAQNQQDSYADRFRYH